MNTKELKILERCYTCEIDAALSGNAIDLCQFKGKLADKLVSDGYIQKASINLGGRLPVTVEGYRLTELGRLAYCTSP